MACASAEQCSFCRFVRYYTIHGWSGWIKDLSESIKCNYFTPATCDKEECMKKREDLIACNR